MKLLVAFISFFVPLILFAQQELDSTRVITKVGLPDGDKTSVKVQKADAALRSYDGMVELIIPEGSVPKNTVISIQPITNLMANGNGKAYRLEPSGIKFNHPLQLRFHYDEQQIQDSMQLLIGIAMQDDKGQWFGVNNSVVDTMAKTISANINHFSDWSHFSEIKIDPDQARLKVNSTIYLAISGVRPSPKLTDADDELSPLEKKPVKVIWSANKIVGGNAVVGKLSKSVGSQCLECGNVYTAPSSVPDQNPVAVSAKLARLTYTTMVKGKSTTFNNLQLVSNILVYDNAYEVKIVSRFEGIAGSELGAVTYVDTGSFVVSVNGKDTRIIEKINRNVPDKLDYKGKCIITQLRPGSGNVNISASQRIKVTPPATEGGNAWIEIVFQKTPTVLPLLQFKCPPVGRGGWTTNTNAQANAMIAPILPAFPQLVKFEAKKGEQTIQEINSGGIYYKMTVKRLEEE